MMLSQTGSKGETKPGFARHNTIGQNFLDRRSADIEASKIFDEVNQDLSIRDFLSGRPPPTYSLIVGSPPPSKQPRSRKPSPPSNLTAVEVKNVDFYSLLRQLQQSAPGRAPREMDIVMILNSSPVDKRSLKHWLDYLELSELQGHGVDVLYRFELEQKDYRDLDEDNRSIRTDAGKTLKPPVEWQPPSASSKDLLSYLRRKTRSMDDKTNDIPPAKVMYDALQVAAAEISLDKAITKLENTKADPFQSAEIARLTTALEWVNEEAESTRAWVVRRRANRRAVLAQ